MTPTDTTVDPAAALPATSGEQLPTPSLEPPTDLTTGEMRNSLTSVEGWCDQADLALREGQRDRVGGAAYQLGIAVAQMHSILLPIAAGQLPERLSVEAVEARRLEDWQHVPPSLIVSSPDGTPVAERVSAHLAALKGWGGRVGRALWLEDPERAQIAAARVSYHLQEIQALMRAWNNPAPVLLSRPPAASAQPLPRTDRGPAVTIYSADLHDVLMGRHGIQTGVRLDGATVRLWAELEAVVPGAVANSVARAGKTLELSVREQELLQREVSALLHEVASSAAPGPAAT